MSTPAAAPDPTRQRIVAAAATCFADHGASRVSLDEVATVAGVHRTTLHRHLPGGREELMLAVLEHEADALVARLLNLVASASSATAAFVEVAAHVVVEGRTNRVVAPLLTESATREAVLGPAAAQLRATAVTVWDAIVTRHRSAGGAVVRLDAERVVDHLFRLVVSLVDEPGAVVDPDQIRAYFRDLVAPALLK